MNINGDLMCLSGTTMANNKGISTLLDIITDIFIILIIFEMLLILNSIKLFFNLLDI
jgi:hypothetical protein